MFINEAQLWTFQRGQYFRKMRLFKGPSTKDFWASLVDFDPPPPLPLSGH